MCVNNLRYHGHKIGLVPDSTCRWCSADEETPLHLLTTCDAAAERRRKWFGDALPSLEDIRGTKASRLIGFWKEVILNFSIVSEENENSELSRVCSRSEFKFVDFVCAACEEDPGPTRMNRKSGGGLATRATANQPQGLSGGQLQRVDVAEDDAGPIRRNQKSGGGLATRATANQPQGQSGGQLQRVDLAEDDALVTCVTFNDCVKLPLLVCWDVGDKCNWAEDPNLCAK
ncbi:unnamed protein product, partial [Trichogramma brassicae]